MRTKPGAGSKPVELPAWMWTVAFTKHRYVPSAWRAALQSLITRLRSRPVRLPAGFSHSPRDSSKSAGKAELARQKRRLDRLAHAKARLSATWEALGYEFPTPVAVRLHLRRRDKGKFWLFLADSKGPLAYLGVRFAPSGAWISAEADLARSVAELDREKPGWDNESRRLSVVRRLEKDASTQGVQAAVDVFGKDAVYKALPCAGLRLSGEVVVDAEGRPVYGAPAPRAVDLFTRAELSVREAEVLRALAQGGSLRDIAVRLGLSQHTVSQLQRQLMLKLGDALSGPVAEAAIAAVLGKRSVE
ncbi:MAG TPA: helix-turn-helix transcriptional regulator [Roseateles sp.]|nr:helix-turn-helix transcriptional regulator [Roseateles sp.]